MSLIMSEYSRALWRSRAALYLSTPQTAHAREAGTAAAGTGHRAGTHVDAAHKAHREPRTSIIVHPHAMPSHSAGQPADARWHAGRCSSWALPHPSPPALAAGNDFSINKIVDENKFKNIESILILPWNITKHLKKKIMKNKKLPYISIQKIVNKIWKNMLHFRKIKTLV